MDPNTHTSGKTKLAYVVSHPIQYQAPLLRRIALEPDIDLTVYFCSDFSVRSYRDPGFGAQVEWDVPLLGGYRHEFLPRVRDTATPTPTSPIAFGFLRRFLKHRFDAVWVHGYSSVNALHAIAAAKIAGVPVLLRAEPWLGDRARSATTLAVKKFGFAMLKPMIDATLSIGTRNAEYWQTYFGRSVPDFQVPYAVDNDYFVQRTQAARPGREQLRAELNLEGDRPVILFASKLQTRKHCDHLVEAYLRMRPGPDQEPRPYLVLVGDGEERAALEKRVAESGCQSVRFAGFRNQSELPRFFDLANVFVLPSRHEPWGLIVNEAMNASLPIIVTDDVGSATDLVQNGVNGYIYPAGNIDALHRALEQILHNPGTANAMGQRARQRVTEWGFEADVRGLRAALTHVTGRLRA